MLVNKTQHFVIITLMLRIVVKVSLLRLLLCYCFFWLCSLNTEIKTLRRLQKSQSQKSSFRGVPLPGLNRWDLFKKLEEMDVTPISLTDSFCQKLNVKWLLFNGFFSTECGDLKSPPLLCSLQKKRKFWEVGEYALTVMRSENAHLKILSVPPQTGQVYF